MKRTTKTCSQHQNKNGHTPGLPVQLSPFPSLNVPSGQAKRKETKTKKGNMNVTNLSTIFNPIQLGLFFSVLGQKGGGGGGGGKGLQTSRPLKL